MSEFNLSNAVSAYFSYASRVASLWTLYIAGVLGASGFAASRLGNLPLPTAVLLTAAYLAFMVAHFHVLSVCVAAQEAISEEVSGRLRADPEVTDYPQSVAAVIRIALSLQASQRTHLAGSLCVIGVIWISALW